jgi:hypothetical protein
VTYEQARRLRCGQLVRSVKVPDVLGRVIEKRFFSVVVDWEGIASEHINFHAMAEIELADAREGVRAWGTKMPGPN